MIADIVGYVYCGHVIRTKRPESEWERRGRFEERTCMRRAEAMLRYTIYRDNTQIRVKSFTSLNPTGWTAQVAAMPAAPNTHSRATNQESGVSCNHE